MYEKNKANDFKNNLIIASFSVWQTGSTKVGWTKYLKSLGLGEKERKLSTKEKKLLALENISLAERIKKADKSRHEKNI